MNLHDYHKFKSVLFQILQPFGISYIASYLFKYSSAHRSANFCGNLLQIKDEYKHADTNRRSELTKQFESIVNSLVLKNGVRKTTYPNRHNAAITSICSNEKLKLGKGSISVLDIPSSVGLSSLGVYKILSRTYKINSYIMADQYFEVLYDTETGCVYDDSLDLLQVKFDNYFFSAYRPHTSGNAFGIIARLLLLPLDFVTILLKNKHAYNKNARHSKLVLLHPEAEEMVEQGLMDYRKTDIFKRINGTYDLIVSFNLLQKNYFPADQINVGVMNLFNALNEGGLLIMGNTESYTISRKSGQKLEKLESVGEF